MLYRMTTGAPIFGLRREIDRLFDDTFAHNSGSFKAEFNNGVLSLHIPKAALPQPKRIEIGGAVNKRHQASVGSGTSQRERQGEMAAQTR